MFASRAIQAVKLLRNTSLLLKTGRRAFCEGPKHQKGGINEGSSSISGSLNGQDLDHKEFDVATTSAASMDGYEHNENNASMSGMLDQIAEQHEDSNFFDVEDEFSGQLMNNNNMEDIPFGEESTSNQHNQRKHKHYQESESKQYSEEDRQFGEFFEKYSKRIFLEMTQPQLDEVKLQFLALLDVLSQKHLKGENNEDTHALDTSANNHTETQKQVELSKQQLLTLRLSADFLAISKNQLNIDESQLSSSAWISESSKILLGLIHKSSQLSAIQEHPKEFFTMVQNYFQNQIFSMEEQDNLLKTVILPNIALLPVSALVKFIQLFKNIENNDNSLSNISFIESSVEELQAHRLNANLTINECLLIQDLLQFPEIRKQSQFLPSFLAVFKDLWQNMNPHQLISVSNLLKRVKQSEHQDIFSSFKAAVVQNLHKFSQFHITNLLQFFNSISKSTKLSENSAILHDLNSRRFELKKSVVMKYLHHFEGKDLREHIDKKILENIFELAQIQNQLDFFKLSQGFSKKQVQKIISSIYEENGHLVEQKQDILNHRISDIEAYSGALLRLGLRDEDILNSLSQQLQTSDISRLSLKEQMSIASNFTQLGMQYPFFEELKQRFSSEIDSYDFSDLNSWENALQLTAYCSQYNLDAKESLELAQRIEPFLLNSIPDDSSLSTDSTTKAINFQDSKKQNRQKKTFLARLDRIIELLTYMPANTFNALSNKLLSVNNKEGVGKRNYFKYLSILLQKGIVSFSFLESNPKRLSYFLSCKEYYLSQFKSLSRHTKALSVPQLDFAHSLVYEINRQSRQIQLIPIPHLVGSFQATFILQSSTKTVHLDLLTSKDVFVNSPRMPLPSTQLKNIMLEKSGISYDYVAQADFFGKDRDILVKDLISKHFGPL